MILNEKAKTDQDLLSAFRSILRKVSDLAHPSADGKHQSELSQQKLKAAIQAAFDFAKKHTLPTALIKAALYESVAQSQSNLVPDSSQVDDELSTTVTNADQAEPVIGASNPTDPESAEKISDLRILRLKIDIPSDQIARLDLAALAHTETGEVDAVALARLREVKKQFDESQTIVLITGIYGIGDSIMEAKMAEIIHKKTGKQVICHVHPALAYFFKNTENVQYVTQIGSQLTEIGRISPDPKPFIIELTTQSNLFNPMAGKVRKRLDPRSDSERIDRILEKGRSEARIASYTHGMHQALERHHLLSNDSRVSEVDYALQLHALGVEVTNSDIEAVELLDRSEVSFDLKMAEGTGKQDLLFVPDAAEGEIEEVTQDGRVIKRSIKSYPLAQLPDFFVDMHNSGLMKLAVLKGITHAEYCDEVIKIARASGLRVVVHEGDNLKTVLSWALLHSKMYLGPDTGVTHLAELYMKAVKQLGKTPIPLLQFFNDRIVSVKKYGSTSGDILVSSATEQEKNQANVPGDMSSKDLNIPPAELASFVISHRV